jgi:hypothetical protein
MTKRLSDLALRKMATWLCKGLPNIDTFDEQAQNLTLEDAKIYETILDAHNQKHGTGIGPLDFNQIIIKHRARK